MDPPPLQRNSTLSSVICSGTYDPSPTPDIRRRQREKGVIDLCTVSAFSAFSDAPPLRKKRMAETECSVPAGKRTNVVHTKNLSRYACTAQKRWDEGAFTDLI